MSLSQQAQQALDAFTDCPGWEQRARLLMLWGERLEALPERHAENLVEGCTSQVWLTGEQQGEAWYFCASSDARLLRGLLALLLVRVNGLSGEALAQMDIAHWFNQLGLSRQLSPSRANGLHAVVQKMLKLVQAKQSA